MRLKTELKPVTSGQTSQKSLSNVREELVMPVVELNINKPKQVKPENKRKMLYSNTKTKEMSRVPSP